MRENLILLHANFEGVDQPAYPYSLISTFVIHFLESITDKFATSKSITF